MNYRDHPLLEGFKVESDDVLREVIVAQLDYAVWVQDGHVGYAPEVKELLLESTKNLNREDLEKFLYHAIVAAVKADRETRARNNGQNPPVSATTG